MKNYPACKNLIMEFRAGIWFKHVSFEILTHIHGVPD